MEVAHKSCAGLDVHKKKVTACALTPNGREIWTFAMMSKELLILSDWFAEPEVTHVAIERFGRIR